KKGCSRICFSESWIGIDPWTGSLISTELPFFGVTLLEFFGVVVEPIRDVSGLKHWFTVYVHARHRAAASVLHELLFVVRVLENVVELHIIFQPRHSQCLHHDLAVRTLIKVIK